jgi:hypothetical protein
MGVIAGPASMRVSGFRVLAYLSRYVCVQLLHTSLEDSISSVLSSPQRRRRFRNATARVSQPAAAPRRRRANYGAVATA